MITIHIEYEIEPDKVQDFDSYAKQWIPLVEDYGGVHHGYFLPYESTNHIAYALFSFSNMAEYEKYREKSRLDEKCLTAYEFARKTACIRQYKRSFMKPIFK